MANKHHMFNVDIATQYGVNAAVILYNLDFWLEKNKANKKHFHDGTYWTYNSIKAYKQLFPYMSPRQISTALKKLEENDIISMGNYNKVAYDRTTWYAITENGYSIMQKCKMDVAEMSNRSCRNVEPIPDSNTVSKPNSNTYKSSPSFKKPTIVEIETYCKERNNGIDAQRFYDYYEVANWTRGKTKIKNWKACVRTWESTAKQYAKDKKPTGQGETNYSKEDTDNMITELE